MIQLNHFTILDPVQLAKQNGQKTETQINVHDDPRSAQPRRKGLSLKKKKLSRES